MLGMVARLNGLLGRTHRFQDLPISISKFASCTFLRIVEFSLSCPPRPEGLCRSLYTDEVPE